MGPSPPPSAYVEAFLVLEREMTPKHRAMLKAHYHAPRRRITAAQLARQVGYANYSGANLQYGILARMVRDVLDFPAQRGYVHLYSLCTFIAPEEPDDHWLFVMRPQVAAALVKLGWI